MNEGIINPGSIFFAALLVFHTDPDNRLIGISK
jgi:hypothetical protein